jgi:myo-inositol-1(or 4)-monophosphatase
MTRTRANPALERHLKGALSVAVDAALEAGELLKRKFGKLRYVSEKADASLVTEADRASEKLILQRLRKRFPNDQIVAEETGLSEGQKVGPFRWHVDPLDGTTNFVHGFPFFCVSIGLEFEASEFVLGVIYAPATGDLYRAYRGGGAFRGSKRLRVSSTPDLTHALLCTGFSMKRDRFLDSELAAFTRLARMSNAIRRTGSAALDLAHVATGQFDGFWERGLSTWDITAGLSLVAEAGGTFSRLDGKTFRLGDEEIIASNGVLHRALLKALT